MKMHSNSLSLLTGTIAISCCGIAHAGSTPIENERLIWHHDLDDDFAGRWVAVADDGTIYATNAATLFAVNPDGSEKWTLDDAGTGEPIDIGVDGTIYTAGPGTIPTDDLVAVNPDGTLQWRIKLPEIIIAGPSVGPDGNIYGAVNQINADFGAFAVDSEGDIAWMNSGDPEITSSNDDWPVAFVGERAIMGIVTSASQGSVIWAFELDGDQDWYGLDLAHEVYGKPTPHPDGFIITRSHTSGLEATAPDGSMLWQSIAPEQGFNGWVPAVGPDGTIYYVDGGDMWALHPDGSTQFYTETTLSGFNNTVSVTPDGSLVLVGGSSIGTTGYVRAFDATDGSPVWQVNIPQQGGVNVFPWSARFAFSPDGNVAYFTTRVGGDLGDARLYALRVGDLTPGDIDGDGDVDFDDFTALLASWGPCADCPADLDGDGDVDFDDFTTLLANWS